MVEIAAPGLPLGIGFGTGRELREVALQPGSVLVFYTDGLVEYDHDVLAGQRNLRQALGALVAQEPMASLARNLRARVFGGGTVQEDDTAVLSIAMRGLARTVQWHANAVPESIPALRAKLRDFWLETPCARADPFDFIAATGEALAIAVEHATPDAAGSLSVRASYDDKGVSVEVWDRRNYQPVCSTPRSELGTTIMRALANEHDLVQGEEGTVVMAGIFQGSVAGRYGAKTPCYASAFGTCDLRSDPVQARCP